MLWPSLPACAVQTSGAGPSRFWAIFQTPHCAVPWNLPGAFCNAPQCLWGWFGHPLSARQMRKASYPNTRQAWRLQPRPVHQGGRVAGVLGKSVLKIGGSCLFEALWNVQCSLHPVAVRYFHHHCACCQLRHQSLGTGAVFGVQIGIPFVQQVNFCMGTAGDFL